MPYGWGGVSRAPARVKKQALAFVPPLLRLWYGMVWYGMVCMYIYIYMYVYKHIIYCQLHHHPAGGAMDVIPVIPEMMGPQIYSLSQISCPLCRLRVPTASWSPFVDETVYNKASCAGGFTWGLVFLKMFDRMILRNPPNGIGSHDWPNWIQLDIGYLNMNQFVGAAFPGLVWFFLRISFYIPLYPQQITITLEWPGVIGVISFFGWTFAEQFQPRSPCAQYVGNAFALLSLRCPSCDSTTSFARCVCFPRWIEMSWNLCKRF